MRLMLIPANQPPTTTLPPLIAQAEPGDLILVHTSVQVTLGERAARRMGKRVRFVRLDDYHNWWKHDTGTPDLEPVEGQWVEMPQPLTLGEGWR